MYTYIYLHFFIPLYTQVQETHKEPFSTISSWMIVACDLLQLQSASVTIPAQPESGYLWNGLPLLLITLR